MWVVLKVVNTHLASTHDDMVVAAGFLQGLAPLAE